jgi:anti-sigma factor RsiW
MHCDRVRELLSPYLDEALPAQDRATLAAHLDTCPGCARFAADLRRLARTLCAVGRHRSSPSLRPRLRRALAEVELPAAERPARPPSRARLSGSGWPVSGWPVSGWPASGWRASGWAAPTLAACALTAVATWWLLSLAEPEARLQHDVLAAHMRALLQETPTQVTSADTHWIKPWFSGRVDFSPNVSDLSPAGFLLLGARLDYVGDRRVGVLVYRRQHHTIDVFVWPNPAGAPGAGRVVGRKGYTLVTWTRDGLSYWAISDLDAAELKTLQRLL